MWSDVSFLKVPFTYPAGICAFGIELSSAKAAKHSRAHCPWVGVGGGVDGLWRVESNTWWLAGVPTYLRNKQTFNYFFCKGETTISRYIAGGRPMFDSSSL